MYYEKQWRMWLMVVPFWVMYMVGGYSLFSMYNLFNLNNNSFYFELCNNYEQQNGYSHFVSLGKAERECCSQKEMSCISNKCNSFNQNKKILTEEIIVCDNRLDKINNKYFKYLCDVNECLEENSVISIV